MADGPVRPDRFIPRGVPEHVCSDNGPEFVAKAAQGWIGAVRAKTAYTAPGSPCESGFIESFNARLRDELLDGEMFYTLAEAKIVVERWWRHFNTVCPHGSLGHKPPAPEVSVPVMTARAARPADYRDPERGARQRRGAIGGVKVVTSDGWFCAGPSGTEEVYKIYAESFRDEARLRQIQDEAQTIINAAFGTA
jgi:hypothetical protein